MLEKVILIKYGEIHLKGHNRPFFERMLLKNIKKALEPFEGIQVIKAQGRYYVENIQEEGPILKALAKVFGLVSMSLAIKLPKDLEQIMEVAEQLMGEVLKETAEETLTFKVESRRADKNFPMDSMALNREIGGRLLDRYSELSVDVHHPQTALQVEIREFAYLYTSAVPGVGGMPVGTNGKAALLLSGGIDSPVAGFMIAKRGVELMAVHFHSFPYTSDRSKEKVIDLCRILTAYCGPIRLHIVPFTKIQQTLYEKCPDSQLTILMRRFMMRIAERIAVSEGAMALITGESIGQVASQTLEGLVSTDDAVSMPVFRPVIGFDKIEIMNLAEQIHTYETSILPYEDCCTVFLPKHPVTKPNLQKIRTSEALVDIEGLIDEAVAGVEVVSL